MTKKNYYITTTLPYVNADPHIGFALEIVQADAIARFKRLQGYDVFFNFGTDEHGLKIYRKALESKKNPQEYVDEYAAKFDNLKKALNLSYNSFIRTTDDHHIKAAQKFWQECNNNGYIYKKKYKIKYCVGCELEKTDSELEKDRCPLHPAQKLEIIEEENYFFRFSQFQKKLLKLYKENPEFVYPKHRLKEIETFVKNGLQDFSISRLKSKLPWGINVPGDPDQIMYVWFEALINYVSAVGWPKDKKKFDKWWPVVQVAGKDNLRQQSAIWQAMLLSVNLPPSKQIFIHGFISIGGQKISKSLGNVINPYDLVKKYGTDAVRYYLLAKIHPYEDSDFTIEKFEETYNADLANGIGNLVARVSKMAEKNGFEFSIKQPQIDKELAKFFEGRYEFNNAIVYIWKKIKNCDVFINENKVWEQKGKKKEKSLYYLINQVKQVAYDLKPFLPKTAEKIEKQFAKPKIKSSQALFPRIK